jgi:segregation and condensation protein B
MSASEPGKKNDSDLAEMDAHEVQEALAEALEAIPEECETLPKESSGQGDVIQLSDDQDIDLPENPFVRDGGAQDPFDEAAALGEHVRMVEALLFAAVEPLDIATMAGRMPSGADIEKALEILQERYDGRGILLQKIGRKFRFVTAPDIAPILEKEQIVPRKLSRAALETLAIIAYHQPCTRADIEEIRGVMVSKGSLDQLMELGWVRLRGRREHIPGRPILYGTSQDFLEHFGLESVSHLPGLADLKAAGLLTARLPAGFQVPTPSDSEEGDDGEGAPEQVDFVQDFIDEDEIDGEQQE